MIRKDALFVGWKYLKGGKYAHNVKNVVTPPKKARQKQKITLQPPSRKDEDEMAERRMFTIKIVESDPFTEMPLSAQALYFHLNMAADDDGFVNNPQKIRRSIDASEDDFEVLVKKRFLLTFENGLVVIKHWRMHNLLRKDRYKPTQYQDQLASLQVRGDGAYTENQPFSQDEGEIDDFGNHPATIRQPFGNQLATK